MLAMWRHLEECQCVKCPEGVGWRNGKGVTGWTVSLGLCVQSLEMNRYDFKLTLSVHTRRDKKKRWARGMGRRERRNRRGRGEGKRLREASRKRRQRWGKMGRQGKKKMKKGGEKDEWKEEKKEWLREKGTCKIKLNSKRKVTSTVRRWKGWNLAWWITLTISTPLNVRQKDCCGFKASLAYAVSFRIAWAAI